mmetsp:Transcript_105599/g.298938  ORF Transcript_105599/g.298938 Transcript_105599/m.298938 type:complete len:293 (-) Transcript_105599:625-1503(-)
MPVTVRPKVQIEAHLTASMGDASGSTSRAVRRRPPTQGLLNSHSLRTALPSDPSEPSPRHVDSKESCDGSSRLISASAIRRLPCALSAQLSSSRTRAPAQGSGELSSTASRRQAHLFCSASATTAASCWSSSCARPAGSSPWLRRSTAAAARASPAARAAARSSVTTSARARALSSTSAPSSKAASPATCSHGSSLSRPGLACRRLDRSGWTACTVDCTVSCTSCWPISSPPNRSGAIVRGTARRTSMPRATASATGATGLSRRPPNERGRPRSPPMVDPSSESPRFPRKAS